MNVLLIGSGGREHALALEISKSNVLSNLYSLPGNPGINQIAIPLDISLENFYIISDKCKVLEIDLVVIGPEQPLADGLSDFLRSQGLYVFGPSKAAAMLESSKGFAKEFMNENNIPTASYRIFDNSSESGLKHYLKEVTYPIVIKADGLAAGKGVVIVNDENTANDVCNDMFSGRFSTAGSKIVVEDFLEGEEASILVITDGNDFVTLAPAQDHKRIYDGDRGPNTGGMGAYAPAPLVNNNVLQKCKDRIIAPVLNGMAERGTPFVGCLYVGIMVDRDGNPYVVEFNARFGDPETQVVLPVFEGDLLRLMFSAAKGKLDKSTVRRVDAGYACSVILASSGYPEKYDKGYKISGIDEAKQLGAIVYHAGTIVKDSEYYTNGGRVLAVTAVQDTLADAIYTAYQAVDKIYFDNIYFRKDIGHRAL